MGKETQKNSKAEDTIKDIKSNEYIYDYINYVEKDIYHIIKEMANKNNLINEFQEYLLSSSFCGKNNDKNVFKYLFNKLKEYRLSSTLLILIYTYDSLTNNFVNLETTICQANIYSENKKWYQDEDIEHNLSNNGLTQNTINRIKQKYDDLYTWFNNKENVDTLVKNISIDKKDSFDYIHSNLTSKLNQVFFANIIPTLNTNELRLDLLPKSYGHFIALTCDIFYSKTFRASNIFSTCETCLNKLENLNDKKTRFRNQDAIVDYYNDNLNRYYNLLKNLDDEENILENNVIYFNISRIFRQDFISSISSPIIKTLINRIDLPSLANFLNDWTKENQSKSMFEKRLPANYNGQEIISSEHINNSFYLSLLEFLSIFNLNLSDTDIESLLEIRLHHENFTDANGGNHYLNRLNTNNLIKQQKSKIEDIYNFLFDLLSQYHSMCKKFLEVDTAGIFNYLLTTYHSKKEDNFKEKNNSKEEDNSKEENNPKEEDNPKEENNTKEEDKNNISQKLLNYITIIIEELEKLPTVNKEKDFKIEYNNDLYYIIENHPAIIAYLMINSANNI